MGAPVKRLGLLCLILAAGCSTVARRQAEMDILDRAIHHLRESPPSKDRDRRILEAEALRDVIGSLPSNDPDHVHITLPDGTSTNFPASQ
jgi:hypothetical protein